MDGYGSVSQPRSSSPPLSAERAAETAPAQRYHAGWLLLGGLNVGLVLGLLVGNLSFNFRMVGNILGDVPSRR